VLPINATAEVNDRLWLLPFFAHNLSNTSGNVELAYVGEYFIEMAETQFAPLAQNTLASGLSRAATDLFRLITQCWDVFVAVCKVKNPPADISAAFPDLARRIGNHLQAPAPSGSVIEAECDRHIRICGLVGVSSLYRSVLSCAQGRADMADSLACLGSMAKELLPILLTLFTGGFGTVLDVKLHDLVVDCISVLVRALALTDAESMVSFFAGIISKVLEADLDAPGDISALADLICAFIPSLDADNAEYVYQLAAPYATSEELHGDRWHKKMIKILTRLLADSAPEVQQAIFTAHREELFGSVLCADLTPFSANTKKLYLRSMRSLVAGGFLDDGLAQAAGFETVLAPILSTVMQCVKEKNNTTQSAAYALLLDIVLRSPVDEVDGQASFMNVLGLLVAGLAGGTPLMVSGATLSVARVCYEAASARRTARSRRGEDLSAGDVAASVLFSSSSSGDSDSGHRAFPVLDQVLPPLIDMLGTEQREICRSSLAFMKMLLMGVWPKRPDLAEQLFSPHVENFLTRVGTWSEETQGAHRTPLKGIMRRLIRRYGIDRVVGVVDIHGLGTVDALASLGALGRITSLIAKTERRRLRKALLKDPDDASRGGNGDAEGNKKKKGAALAAPASESHGLTFDQALRESDSEDDDLDEREQAADDQFGASDSDESDEDDDAEPEDLLSSHLSGRKSRRGTTAMRRRPVSHSFPSTDDSRLIVEDPEEEGETLSSSRRSLSSVASAFSRKSKHGKEQPSRDAMFVQGDRSRAAVKKRPWVEDLGDDDYQEEEDEDVEDGTGKNAVAAAENATTHKSWEPKGQRAPKRRKQSAAAAKKAPGSEFSSNRAGGDVRRKGAALEPFAYMPLDPSTMNKRGGRKKATAQYESVVRGAKKGAQSGAKGRRKR
jgi:ribosomal RNA-processing protein 12